QQFIAFGKSVEDRIKTVDFRTEFDFVQSSFRAGYFFDKRTAALKTDGCCGNEQLVFVNRDCGSHLAICPTSNNPVRIRKAAFDEKKSIFRILCARDGKNRCLELLTGKRVDFERENFPR